MSENYFKLPERVNQSLIERAKKLSTANLADGMSSLSIRRGGCMDPEINPVDDKMKFCATAATVETEDGDNLPIHVAIYQSEPGYVLVVDGKGYRERAYMGDLMVGASKAIGLDGVVLDGYVRDKEGLKELNLPVFARGFMQRTPAKKGPGKINTPIFCAGVEVRPGDLICGDYDGVIVIPKEHIEKVLKKAEEKVAYEEKRTTLIEAYEKNRLEGKETASLAPQWVSDMMNK